MDKEKAIAYVKYGLNENITPRQVKMTILGANLLYPIGIFCGIAWGNTAMQLGLAILSISVFTILSLLIYQRGVTLKKLLIVYSILGIELAINCMLTCFVCSYKLGTSPIIIPFVIAIPLCVFFLYVILTKKSVEEGKFLQGKHVKKGRCVLVTRRNRRSGRSKSFFEGCGAGYGGRCSSYRFFSALCNRGLWYGQPLESALCK